MNYRISLAGDLGSGKSTVAALLKEQLPGFEYYSTGAIMRDIAKKHGMSIEELNIYMETHSEIDREIDEGLVRLCDDPRFLIIDSRMAWHFVSDTFKVYLSCEAETSAARIMNAKRAEEPFSSFEEALEGIRGRRASEKKRYLEQYGTDIKDMANYDLILDTTYVSPETVADKLCEAFGLWKQDRTFRAAYICPERLLYDSDEVLMDEAERIADRLEEDILPSEVTVRESDGTFYVDSGTNSALAYALCDYNYVPARYVPGKVDMSRDYVKMKTSL